MENEKIKLCNSIYTEIKQAYDQSIIFGFNGQESIRLLPNGDIFVKGELVTNSEQVVNGMREFLQNIDSQRVIEYKERIEELESQFIISKHALNTIKNFETPLSFENDYYSCINIAEEALTKLNS